VPTFTVLDLNELLPEAAREAAHHSVPAKVFQHGFSSKSGYSRCTCSSNPSTPASQAASVSASACLADLWAPGSRSGPQLVSAGQQVEGAAGPQTGRPVGGQQGAARHGHWPAGAAGTPLWMLSKCHIGRPEGRSGSRRRGAAPEPLTHLLGATPSARRVAGRPPEAQGPLGHLSAPKAT
jgi:hypothetical protein